MTEKPRKKSYHFNHYRKNIWENSIFIYSFKSSISGFGRNVLHKTMYYRKKTTTTTRYTLSPYDKILVKTLMQGKEKNRKGIQTLKKEVNVFLFVNYILYVEILKIIKILQRPWESSYD